MTWERIVLRKIYGPTYENVCWRIKMNQIYNKSKSPNIVTVIRIGRLEWRGHVAGMDAARTVKNLLEGKPGGGRKKGRPALRWVGVDESDLRNVGVKRWRSRALDRTEWASVVREAKSRLNGL
jgi:hypothetical protein